MATSAEMEQQQQAHNFVWFCPSRWTLAHHDARANIQTFGSHMCLGDFAGDGEHLLVLVNFNWRQQQQQDERRLVAPLDCRWRVYRGYRLVGEHFLAAPPACLVAVSQAARSVARPPLSNVTPPNEPNVARNRLTKLLGKLQNATATSEPQACERLKLAAPSECVWLAMPIGSHVYMREQLQPALRACLSDCDAVLDSLNRCELDAWLSVRCRSEPQQLDALYELLASLRAELGARALTSATLGYLATRDARERASYVSALCAGGGDDRVQFMRADTICCAAALLPWRSDISTRCGPAGHSSAPSTSWLHNASHLLHPQLAKSALLVATEDRHLLVLEPPDYAEVRAHWRLPAPASHLLVERRLPSSFANDTQHQHPRSTYCVLAVCRNRRVYALDVHYDDTRHSGRRRARKARALVALASAAVDACWTRNGPRAQFAVATMDARVHGFCARTGAPMWRIELELPVTCLVYVPALCATTSSSSKSEDDSADNAGLLGVASRSGRVDFYTAHSGRIVDSLYVLAPHYVQAMTFGQFGRSESGARCLCATTQTGHLLVMQLRRSARFAHGQCLSSAAAHATDALLRCGGGGRSAKRASGDLATISQQPQVPSAFELSRACKQQQQQNNNIADAHASCGARLDKRALDAFLERPKMRPPPRDKSFVRRLLAQSRACPGELLLWRKSFLLARTHKIHSAREEFARRAQRVHSHRPLAMIIDDYECSKSKSASSLNALRVTAAHRVDVWSTVVF